MGVGGGWLDLETEDGGVGNCVACVDIGKIEPDGSSNIVVSVVFALVVSDSWWLLRCWLKDVNGSTTYVDRDGSSCSRSSSYYIHG